MARKTFEPRQARSRESTRRILKAAAEVLGQHGVEGTTIPRIAEHAGLTPGALYRRFRDKEALLEAVLLGILKGQERHLRTTLTPDLVRQVPLAVFAEQLVTSMVVSYRANAGLLRALRQFAQGRFYSLFCRRVAKLEMRSVTYVVELFLLHRQEIKHPEPPLAVSFAVMTLTSTLVELILADHNLKYWQAVIPKDDRTLQRELLRTFLSYLGVEQKRERVVRPPRER